MAKIELFLVDDADEISDSIAIEGDFDDLKEKYDEMKSDLEEFAPEEEGETAVGTYEPPDSEKEPV